MADVITVACSITHVATSGSGRASVSTPSASKSITMAGTDVIYGTQATSTTEAALNLGNRITAGSPGYIYIKNVDTTDTIYVGKVQVSSDGDAMAISLLPGEFCVFRAKSAPYVEASANTPICEYYVYIL